MEPCAEATMWPPMMSGSGSGAFRVRRTCREENLKTFLPAANKMGLSGYPCSKVLEKGIGTFRRSLPWRACWLLNPVNRPRVTVT